MAFRALYCLSSQTEWHYQEMYVFQRQEPFVSMLSDNSESKKGVYNSLSFKTLSIREHNVNY